MSSSTVEPTAAARGFSGELLTDEHPSYDEARTTFNALVDRRPAAIMRCRSTATSSPRSTSPPTRVHGRGPRRGPQRRGTRRLRRGPRHRPLRLDAVEVDPDARIARAGGGTNWRAFDAATQRTGSPPPAALRHDRCRRPDPRRRHRLSARPLWALLRQPRRRRDRHRRRRRRGADAERTPTSSGAPGRRRQFRRCHAAGLPAPPDRRGRRRHDDLAARRRRRT